MQRLADEAVARHEGPVVAAAARAAGAGVARRAGAGDRSPLTGSVEVQPARLEACPDIPDRVEDGAVTLIRRAERVLAADVLPQLERDRNAADALVGAAYRLTWVARRIAERTKRVVGGELPLVAETLGKRRFERPVVRPTLHVLTLHEAPVGKRPRRDVAERNAVAGRGVIREILVEVDFLRAPAGVDEVRLDGEVGEELPLDADRRLVAVGDLMVVARGGNLRADLPAQTVGGKRVGGAPEQS